MKIRTTSNRLHCTRKTILSYDLEFLQHNMFDIPVPFSKEHKNMLAHCKELLDYQNGMIAINPKHNKLVTALRTAVENGEGSLDKKQPVTMICLIVSDCRYSSGIDYICLDSSFGTTSLFMKF